MWDLVRIPVWDAFESLAAEILFVVFDGQSSVVRDQSVLSSLLCNANAFLRFFHTRGWFLAPSLSVTDHGHGLWLNRALICNFQSYWLMKEIFWSQLRLKQTTWLFLFLFKRQLSFEPPDRVVLTKKSILVVTPFLTGKDSTVFGPFAVVNIVMAEHVQVL